MTSFERLKQECTTACHERKACEKGFCDMLAAENVSQLMAVWRANWDDLVTSKYTDIINEKLPALYPSLKEEMNAAGIYVNECPKAAPENILVIVTDSKDDVVEIFDHARCYVLGAANIWAWGHSQVYSENNDHVRVVLKQHAYGYVKKGHVIAYGFSRLWFSAAKAWLHDGVECEAHGGVVHAGGYRRINAFGDTKVVSKTDRNISLFGNAHIVV